MVTNIIDTNSINIINNMGYEDIMKDIAPRIVGKITEISNHIINLHNKHSANQIYFHILSQKIISKKFEINIQDILDYK